MSGILEKTIESLGTLLSPLSSGPGISVKAMFERCMAARTKRVSHLRLLYYLMA